MGFTIIFAPQALERLEEIVRYIAKDNPLAAERYGLRLLESVQVLSDFPELGVPYPKRKEVRRLWCKPYFIYYRVRKDSQTVEIMDYWHSARRMPVW